MIALQMITEGDCTKKFHEVSKEIKNKPDSFTELKEIISDIEKVIQVFEMRVRCEQENTKDTE